MMKPHLTFLIDTREHCPLEFAAVIRTDHFSSATTQRVTLREGDYSVALDHGAPLPIRLERKSLGDLYSCVGLHRERFEAELWRLRRYDYRAIIIEATLTELTAGFRRSRVHPNAALGSLCAWAIRFGLAIWFVETHEVADTVAQRLLELFAVLTLRREHHSRLELAIYRTHLSKEKS